MDQITLQPIGPGDIPAALPLLVMLNPTTPEDELRRRIATIFEEHPHYHAVGAFSGGELIGLAGAWVATKIWCGKYLEIDNIIVHPDHRSAKLGSRLIQHFEALARELDCRILTLDSYTSNYPSHRLYHRLGLEIRGFHFVKPLE